LVFDLRPDTPDELRVRSNIFDVTEQCVCKQIEK